MEHLYALMLVVAIAALIRLWLVTQGGKEGFTAVMEPRDAAFGQYSPRGVDRLAEDPNAPASSRSMDDLRRWMVTPFTEPSGERAYTAEGEVAAALPTIPGKSRFGYW